MVTPVGKNSSVHASSSKMQPEWKKIGKIYQLKKSQSNNAIEDWNQIESDSNMSIKNAKSRVAFNEREVGRI